MAATNSDGGPREAVLRAVGDVSSELTLPFVPLPLAFGSDRAQRAVVAARRQPDPEDGNSSSPGIHVQLWDGTSPAAQPIVDADNGKPLRAVAVAISSKADAANGVLVSTTAGMWSCGSDGQARMLFPPRKMPGSVVFAQLACGGAHALALTPDGRLFAWGSNTRGQLGMGDDVDRSEPVEVPVERAAAAAAGAAAAAAAAAAIAVATAVEAPSSQLSARRGSVLRSSAASVRQGTYGEGAFGGHTVIVSVGAALVHSAAVSSVGAFFTWGDGGDGRLGLNDATARRRSTPAALSPPPAPTEADLNRRRASLMGSFRTATVFSTALNRTSNRTSETGSQRQSAADAAAMARAQCNAARGLPSSDSSSSGPQPSVMRQSHQLPLSSAPARMQISDSWLCPACAERHSAGITSGGQLLTWGRAADGRLGHGKPFTDCLAPRVVTALKGLQIVSVALGRAHSVAVTFNGRVYAWGASDAGQCGPQSGRSNPGVPRALFMPQLLQACAAGDATIVCCKLNLELAPAASGGGHSEAWSRAAGADGDAPTAAAVWRRAGSSKKIGATTLLNAAGVAHARSVAALEEERQRRMARWPRGVALWKLALRKLAVERPSLWRVAQLHACARDRPERLGRVAEWYAYLTDSVPTAVREMRSGFAEGPLSTCPAPPRWRGYEAHPAPAYYWGTAALGASGESCPRNSARGIDSPDSTARHRATSALRQHSAAPAHRAPPTVAPSIVAQAAAVAALKGSDASPLLTALLSPRTFMPNSYPKKAAIDTNLPYGVWSADFSWRRGEVPSAGNAAATSGPGTAGENALRITPSPPRRPAPRMVLGLGTAAPHSAAVRSVVAASAGSGDHSERMTSSRPHDGADRSGASLPFGQRRPAALALQWATPPATRYTPSCPADRRPRVVDFGAGALAHRTSAVKETANGPDIGPGTYTPRSSATSARAPQTRMAGPQPSLAFHEPTPAPGDVDVYPPTPAPTYSFARAKSGRMDAPRGKVAIAPSVGLAAWAAVEPTLVRAGVVDATVRPGGKMNARANGGRPPTARMPSPRARFTAF